jgi:zinc protease
MRFGSLSRSVLVCLLLLRCVPAFAADPKPDSPALRAAASLYEGIRVEKLDNGLHVYLKPIKGAPMVTTMVAYKVGSVDEDLDNTGLSHYLEHLMFKGTDKINPGDIDRLTLRNGGQNNAYTSGDYTIFHFDFAADRWEPALEIEADRMRNLRIDAKHEFQQEKGAVIEELQRNEDRPWDLEQKAILPLLFGKKSPYGHPVIGERKHVQDATAAIIKAHYDKWYHPNNASLVIVGGFDPDKTVAKIKKLFGPIPSKKLPERKAVPVVKRAKPVYHEFASKFQLPRMLMGFNGVRAEDADAPALDVLQAILTGGRTGRLYKKLVEGAEVATNVSSNNDAGRYPGWFSIQVELLEGKDRKAVEKLILAELERLRAKPVTEAELKRAQQGMLTDAIFGRESVHDLADSIARGVTTNDLEYLKNQLPNLMKVTAKDVQHVARKYLDPEQRVVVWSVPKREGADNSGTGRRSDAPFTRARATARVRFAEGTEGSALSLKDAKRVELPNGLVLLLLENHRLPIVVAEAAVRNVSLLEPEDKAGVAALVGYLLDEGTTKHTGPEIAELIENVGGTLSVTSTGGGIRALAPHRSLALGLLFESLSQPSFPKDAFNRQRERLLAEIDEAERQPDTKAQMVYRELAYGKHPLGRPSLGRRKTAAKLTRDDCIAFHRKVFVPGNTIVAIVGDFNIKDVIAEVTRLTADWKKAPVPKTAPPAVDKPKDFNQTIITVPAAAQLAFYMGHVGIRRSNPDYYKLLVMDYVLGTGPGFTDRLSARMRDRQGLAYTVSANITNSAEVEPGLFTCYVGTEAKNFAVVKKMFMEEIARLRKEKPTQEEVDDVKNYLVHSLPLQLTTSAAIAGQLVYVERHGLGLSFLDDYRKAVEAVTPEDVRAVAAKYLDPKRMILVAAGAIDANGKPIDKLPAPKK